MSTAVEDAQTEQSVTSSAQNEATETEKRAPTTKVDSSEENAESQDAEKKSPSAKRNGHRTYDNGVLKSSPQVISPNKRNNNKYDPSILPETDDAKMIRRQVCFGKLIVRLVQWSLTYTRSSSTSATATFPWIDTCGI